MGMLPPLRSTGRSGRAGTSGRGGARGRPGNVDNGDIGRSLEAAIRLLGQTTGQAVQADAPGTTGEPGGDEQLRGHGTGGDGLVEAVVAGYGRLESLQISPSLLRAGTEAIAEYVREAVRAAQDDEQHRRQQLLGGGGPDVAALHRQLEGVAEDAWRGFDRMIGDLDALTRRLDRR